MIVGGGRLIDDWIGLDGMRMAEGYGVDVDMDTKGSQMPKTEGPNISRQKNCRPLKNHGDDEVAHSDPDLNSACAAPIVPHPLLSKPSP